MMDNRETTCPYLTAATLLAANNASHPLDDKVPEYMRLINNAVKFMDDLSTRGTIVDNGQLHMVRSACIELNHSVLRQRDQTFFTRLSTFDIF